MVTLELTEQQVVDMVRQLPPERKRTAILALASEGQHGRAERLAYAENQFRRLASEDGRDWDAMSEDEREALANAIIHEDRACP